MGHEAILVIGDNFRDQLDKFQRTEYADPTSRHFVAVDILEQAKSDYRGATKRFLRHTDGTLRDPYDAEFWRPLPNGGKQLYVPEGYTPVGIPVKEIMGFLDWAKNRYGDRVIAEGQEPDLFGKNTLGWIRVNAVGDVVELFERKILGGFFDWFEKTEDSWKLKPGAGGLVTNLAEVAPAIDGFAGSARKAAIDFDGMRAAIRKGAAERWDSAAAACGSKTWEPFEVIWKRHAKENLPYSHERRSAAGREWAQQPAVKAIIDLRLDDSRQEQMPRLERTIADFFWNDHTDSGIDPLRLPRNQYMERYGLRFLLRYGSVIRDGVLLDNIEERQLFDSISEETDLTLALVHC